MNTQENIQVRKRLFEIILKFIQGKQKNNDIKEMSEIFIYHAPYKNRIVHKTKSEDLKIDFKKMPNDEACYENNEIDFSSKAYKNSFLDNLLTLGHEYTHYIQDLVNQADKAHKNIKLIERVRRILYSIELPSAGGGIYSFLKTYKYLNLKLKPKEVSGICATLYLQLPDEENARKCSFQFAKEILNALKSDELCPEVVKQYIELEEQVLNGEWKNELEIYDKNYYTLRKVYNKAINDLEFIPYEEIIAKSNQPKLQEELICGKMLSYRKQGMNKKEYFKHLFNSCGLFYTPNEYENIKSDLKNLTIEYLSTDKEVDISHMILLLDYIKVNNKYYKDENLNFVQLSDLPEICIKLLNNGNTNTIYSFVEGIFNISISKKSKNNIVQTTLKKYLTKKQCQDIYWELVQNQDLTKAITNERERLAKKQEEIDFEENKKLTPIEEAELLIKQTNQTIDKVNLDLIMRLDNYISCGKQALAKTQRHQSSQAEQIED